jgi:hypothetical protein
MEWADAASVHKQLASFHEVMILAESVISTILPAGVASSIFEMRIVVQLCEFNGTGSFKTDHTFCGRYSP